MNEELPVIQIENIHRALLTIPDSSTRTAALRDLETLRTVLEVQVARIVQLNRMIPPDMQLHDAHRVKVAFRAFLNLAKVLGLTWAQKSSLLDVPERTLRRWAVREPCLTQRSKNGWVLSWLFTTWQERHSQSIPRDGYCDRTLTLNWRDDRPSL